MIMLHDSAHERLLERLAAGDPVSAEERELVSACPDCAQLERELDTLRVRLERGGERQRSVVRAALATPPSADGRAQLERLLRGQRSPRGRPSGWRVGVFVAAVAAGLALWLWPFGGRTPAAPPGTGVGVMLGSLQIEALAPSGPVASYSLFRFRLLEPVTGWYTVKVFEVGGEPSDPLLVSPELEAASEINEWTPTPAQQAEIPDAFQWCVEFVPHGEARPLRSAYFSASRSPH